MRRKLKRRSIFRNAKSIARRKQHDLKIIADLEETHAEAIEALFAGKYSDVAAIRALPARLPHNEEMNMKNEGWDG